MERDSVLLALLEERVTAMRADVLELRTDVDELMRERVAAESIARAATARHVRSVRGRELAMAAAGLALTALNVAISVWGG